MSDPTGDALRANEKVVEAVARALYDSHQFVREWSHPKAQQIHGEYCRREARAAIVAYEKAMKGEG